MAYMIGYWTMVNLIKVESTVKWASLGTSSWTVHIVNCCKILSCCKSSGCDLTFDVVVNKISVHCKRIAASPGPGSLKINSLGNSFKLWIQSKFDFWTCSCGLIQNKIEYHFNGFVSEWTTEEGASSWTVCERLLQTVAKLSKLTTAAEEGPFTSNG